MLEVDVGRRLGSFQIEAAFSADLGVTVLFGRSGAGKSSVINMIGGLLRPNRGRIACDGRVLFDGGNGVDVAAAKRRIGYVFQDGRLFPHLTVRNNLLFGQWFAPKGERYIKLDQVVELLGIGHLLKRRPGALSGGEKQRVAIGRALLASPRLLLMDEPLASLDAGRRLEILAYIERLRDETKVPIIYVSHSVAEVTRLATTMILMSEGRVAAAGHVSEIMSRLDLRPLTGRFEAGAVLEATVADHDTALCLTRLALITRGREGLSIRVPLLDASNGASLRVRVRARDVAIALRAPTGTSILNALPAVVAELSAAEGPFGEVRLDVGGQSLLARITRASMAELDLKRGMPVYALIKSASFDRRSIGPSAHLDDQLGDDRDPLVTAGEATPFESGRTGTGGRD